MTLNIIPAQPMTVENLKRDVYYSSETKANVKLTKIPLTGGWTHSEANPLKHLGG